MIRRQVVMPVSPERLWEALTDPDQLSRWFGGSVEWEMSEGSPARFCDDDGTVRSGTVEAVRPARHLRFRWSAEGSDDPAETEVSYLLEPVEDGTRLTIQERRIVPAGDAQAFAGRWSRWDTRLAGAWMSLHATGARV